MVDYLCRSAGRPAARHYPVNNNAMARQDAYVEAMRQLKMKPEVVETTAYASWDFEKFGFDETLRILSKGGFPTQTVLCANDRVAFGVIAAAFQSGLKVGRDADSDLRRGRRPRRPSLVPLHLLPLTTVAQNYNEIGRLAIELLLFKLGETSGNGETFREDERILLSAEIMLRGSARYHLNCAHGASASASRAGPQDTRSGQDCQKAFRADQEGLVVSLVGTAQRLRELSRKREGQQECSGRGECGHNDDPGTMVVAHGPPAAHATAWKV